MRRDNINSTFAVTLAELLIAASLILFVLLVVASLDFAARRFYSDAEKATTALNDITLAMEYMARTSEAAIGDLTATGQAFTSHAAGACGGGYADGFGIRVDSDKDGRVSAGDTQMQFCYNSTAHTIEIPGLPTEVIANRVTGFSVETPGSPPAPVSEIKISLMARDNPAIDAGPKNPQVNIQSSAYLRAASAR